MSGLFLDPARLRAAVGGTPGAPPNGHQQHRGPYRDDLPELWRGRSWTVTLPLLTDAVAIDEVKRAAGYVEPEGSGRWGTAQRRLLAEVTAEAQGRPAPGSLGRECGQCVNFRTDQPGIFDQRLPGGCAKLRVVAFAYASCGLFRGIGQPESLAGLPVVDPGIVQASGDLMHEDRPGFAAGTTDDGRQARQRPIPPLGGAVLDEPSA